MTGMQLIIPPLEDEDETGSLHIANRTDTTRGAYSNGASKAAATSKSSVLPEELRENFEAMKAVSRQARRATNENSHSEEPELKRKARDKAVETAVAIDSEISKWQNSIAELESMLTEDQEGNSEDDDGEDSSDDGGAVGDEIQQPLGQFRFPSLPPVIPPEDDEIISTAETDCMGSPSSEISTTTGPEDE